MKNPQKLFSGMTNSPMRMTDEMHRHHGVNAFEALPAGILRTCRIDDSQKR